MPYGAYPTPTEPMTVPVTAEITVTLLVSAFETNTRASSGSYVTQTGSTPTGIVATTVKFVSEMTLTVPTLEFVTMTVLVRGPMTETLSVPSLATKTSPTPAS